MSELEKIIQDELDYHEAQVVKFKRRLDEHRKEFARKQYAAQGNKIYKLFITTPVYHWPDNTDKHPIRHMLKSVGSCLSHPGLDADYRAVIGDADIGRARATTMMHYLFQSKPWDFWLMVDWDIEFRAADVYRMLQRMEEFEIGCMGGPYAFKTDNGDKAGKIVMRHAPGAEERPEHYVDCHYVGGGFTCVSASAVNAIMEKFPKLRYWTNPDLDEKKSPTYALWTTVLLDRPDWGEGAREYLSEDYSFCHRMVEAGERVCLDLMVYLKHWSLKNGIEKCYALPVNQMNPGESNNG